MPARRLHPLSVVRKAVTSGGQLALFAAFFGATSGDRLGLDGPVTTVGLAVAAFVIGAAYRVAYYYRFSYELTDDELLVASGVFARQQREIPLDRVQNVDISRPFTTRLLGLAVVKFETAGGSTTEASLDAVSASEAERLQREAGPRGRRGTSEKADESTIERVGTEESGQTLYEIDDRELAILSAVSFRPGAFAIPFVGVPFGGQEVLRFYRRVFGLLGIDLQELAAMDAVALLGLAAGTVAAYLVAVWIVSAALTFLRYYGFRLERYGDELRYERGLLGRYSGTIPLDKVQTVTITENVFSRWIGYAGLAVETAGYAPGSDAGGSETTVPLAARGRVIRLARAVLAASDHTGRYQPAFTPDEISLPATTEVAERETTDETDWTNDADETDWTNDADETDWTNDADETTQPVVDPSFTQPEPIARRWYRRRYLLAVGVLTLVGLGVARLSPMPTLAGLTPVVLAPLAPVAARLKHTHRGYHETEWSLLTREGFWRRRTRIVPSFRLQTVLRTRTLFQRRWGVASVVADTASSASLVGGDPTVHDVDPAVASALEDRLVDRLTRSLAERKQHERRQAETTSAVSAATSDGNEDASPNRTDSTATDSTAGEPTANGGAESAKPEVPDSYDPEA